MIIKHIVELETVINENSNEPSVKAILNMPEDERQNFFQAASVGFISEFLVQANAGNTWAELRVAQ
jgi:hypothetical protein